MRKSDFKTRKKFRELARPLSDEELAELKHQIQKDGCQTPVVITKDDVIVDGHHRDAICCELGIETPFIIRSWRTENEAYEWAIRAQLGRRNLGKDDFRELLGRLYNAQKQAPHRPEKKGDQNDPLIKSTGKTAEKLADEHGVSQATVKRAGKRVEAIDQLVGPAKTLARDKKLTDAQVKVLASKSKEDQTQIARDIRVGKAKPGDILKPKTRSKKKGAVKEVSPAKMCDQLSRKFVSPLVRGIDNVAKINGGKGRYHSQANKSLNSLIGALKQMRVGKK